MGDAATKLQALSDKLDKMLAAVDANAKEINQIKMQYSSLNVAGIISNPRILKVEIVLWTLCMASNICVGKAQRPGHPQLIIDR